MTNMWPVVSALTKWAQWSFLGAVLALSLSLALSLLSLFWRH
jgi:hypothetical protein